MIVRIYFLLFLVLCKRGAVVGRSEVSKDCVGQSCQESDHDHISASKEEEHNPEMSNFMKKNLEIQMSVDPGKHDDKSAVIDEKFDSEDEERILDARDLPRLRSVQQQKAIEESRRKFLIRRSISSTSSDDEVKELNRLIQDSYQSTDKDAELHSGEKKERIYNHDEIDDYASSHQKSQQSVPKFDIPVDDSKMKVTSSAVDDEDNSVFEDDDSFEFEDEDDGYEGEIDENQFDTVGDANIGKVLDTGDLGDKFIAEKKNVHAEDSPHLQRVQPDIHTEKLYSQLERDTRLKERQFASFKEQVKSDSQIENTRSKLPPTGVKELARDAPNRMNFDKPLNRETFEPHKHPKREYLHDENKLSHPSRTAEGKRLGSLDSQHEAIHEPDRASNSFDRRRLDHTESPNELANESENLVKGETEPSEPVPQHRPRGNSFLAGMIRKTSGLPDLHKGDSLKDVKAKTNDNSHRQLRNTDANIDNHERKHALAHDGNMKSIVESRDNNADKISAKGNQNSLNMHPHVHGFDEVPISELGTSAETSNSNNKNILAVTVETSVTSKRLPPSQGSEMQSEQPVDERSVAASESDKLHQPSSSILDADNPDFLKTAERLQFSLTSGKSISESLSESTAAERAHMQNERSTMLPASERPVMASRSGLPSDSATPDSESEFQAPINEKNPVLSDSDSVSAASTAKKPPTPLDSQRLSVPPSDRLNSPNASESSDDLLQGLESNSPPKASTTLSMQSNEGPQKLKSVDGSSSHSLSAEPPQEQSSSESFQVPSASEKPKMKPVSHTINLSPILTQPVSDEPTETFDSKKLSKAPIDTSYSSFDKTEADSSSNFDGSRAKEQLESDSKLKQDFDSHNRPGELSKVKGKSGAEFEHIQREIDYLEMVKQHLKEDKEGNGKTEERAVKDELEAKNVTLSNEGNESSSGKTSEAHDDRMLDKEMLGSAKEKMSNENAKEVIGIHESDQGFEDLEEIEMPLDEESDRWDEDSSAYRKESVISEGGKSHDGTGKQDHSRDQENETHTDLKLEGAKDMKTENDKQEAESHKMINAKQAIVEQIMEEVKFDEHFNQEHDADAETFEADNTQELGFDAKAKHSYSREGDRTMPSTSETHEDELERAKAEQTDKDAWNEVDKLASVSSEILEISTSTDDSFSSTESVPSKPGTDFVNFERHVDEAKQSADNEISGTYEETGYSDGDGSFVARFLNLFDYLGSTIFNWLPSTVQSLISYFALSLNPSTALTVCIISSATFFFISVVAYCRKSQKSDTKAKSSDVPKKMDSQYQQERHDLRKEVDSLRIKLMDMQSQNRTANTERQVSISQLNLMKNERDVLKQNVVDLENRFQQLQALVEARNQTIQTEREQSYSYQQANKQLSAHIACFELQMSQMTNHWSAAQKNSVDLQSQIQCLTEELSVMQTEKDRLYMELEDSKERIQKLTQKVKKMQQDETKYHEEIAQKEQELQAVETLVAHLQILGNDKTGMLLNDDSSRQNDNDRKDPCKTKESVHEMLKNVAEVSEMCAKMKDLEAERDLLKLLISSELQSRSKLEDETKHLKDLVVEEIKKREEAERKAKDATVRTEVLSGYFQNEDLETRSRRLGSSDRGIGHIETSGLQDFAGEGRTKELNLKDYREKAEFLEKEMLKADAEHRRQLATQEKKTQENWLLARQNERDANDFKNEASTLKLKVMELETRLDDMQSNKPNADLSAVIPDVALVRPPLHPHLPLLPPVPPPIDQIFPSERLEFFGPPLLPFPPPFFDIPPPPPNHPHFDPRIHRRSLPFNTRQPKRQDHSSPLPHGVRHHRRSPSPTAGDSSFSSGSLKVSPVPTGKDSPHAGIQSPPKIIDRPGPEGPRPVPVRPRQSQRFNQGDQK